MVDVGASVHTLGVQGPTAPFIFPVQVPSEPIEPSQEAIRVRVPLHFPSDPIYPSQVAFVPE